MARQQPLHLIFQWHMHQPFYRDAKSGRILLPWVRLHATKDYTDMAWHLERYPDIKAVFNLVPSLLKQIQDYHDFSSVQEQYLELAVKQAESLTDEDKYFILTEFFPIQSHRRNEISPRFDELYQLVGENPGKKELNEISQKLFPQDFRDLQVWHLLAWSGMEIRKNPDVRQLISMEKNYTEEDKKHLLGIHQQSINHIIPRYKTLSDSGQIEITGSPYAHPILPLLIDSEIMRISMPQAELPLHRVQFPDEAERQVSLALEMFKEEFQLDIKGMWPSEGAVSEATLELLKKHQLRYISTDNNLLAKSLSRGPNPAHLTVDQKYQPYNYSTTHGDLAIYFRDQELSDRLSFQYGGMVPERAADDFFAYLHRVDKALPDDNYPYVVVITMDGENAWEYFQHNGKSFFDLVYGRLTESDRIHMTTFSEHLDRVQHFRQLEWIYPGSWINSDYHYWIGDPLKNAAWDRLQLALRMVNQKYGSTDSIPEELNQALIQAEGSDWFWWYGKPNYSEHDQLFDRLFCNSLRKLLASAEVTPFSKVGGLADVAGALPKVLENLGVDIRIITPGYGSITWDDYDCETVAEFSVPVGKQTIDASVVKTLLPETQAVQAYFIRNDKLFGRKGVYTDPESGRAYEDNDDRFLFFMRAILQWLDQSDWIPDILHSNDHHTALLPAYTSIEDSPFHSSLGSIRNVFTIHNMGYQGIYSRDIFSKIGLPESILETEEAFEFHGQTNFMKAALFFADKITTVSPTYAEEIMSSEEFGFGLEKVVRKRKDDVVGILNGVDYSDWSPDTDELIPYNYSIKDMSGKQKNREELLRKNRLIAQPSIPVIGMVSRLVDQKGFDLIDEILDDLLSLEIRMVVLGTGERRYHRLFEEAKNEYPDKIAVNFTYDNPLAHLIEAGSDMFLMPSKYEPCGLNQMYSLRYGTIPIVHATGGLADTIDDYQPSSRSGNGFSFSEYTPEALMEAVTRAIKTFRNKAQWKFIRDNAMRCNYSWEVSAKKYKDLYDGILPKDE